MIFATYRFWNKAFALEVLITLISTVYWWFFPAPYLVHIGDSTPEVSDRYVLYLYAGLNFCILGLFQTSILTKTDIDRSVFNHYQACLMLFNVYSFALTVFQYAVYYRSGLLMTQLVSSGFWGLLRLAYLLDTHFLNRTTMPSDTFSVEMTEVENNL